MSCLNCLQDARFVTYRPKIVTCLLGDLRLWRAYYHCPHCAQGCCPWDQTLRLLNRRTPGAEEVITLLGTLDSFVQVADRTLYKTTGLSLSESTVQRATEAVGCRLGDMLAADQIRFSAEKSWPWHHDASGRLCAYVSVDATGVMMQGVGERRPMVAWPMWVCSLIPSPCRRPIGTCASRATTPSTWPGTTSCPS